MYLEDERLSPCIDATLACYRSCSSVANARSIPEFQAHRDLLEECAAACRATAHQLVTGSGDLPGQLSACAAICDRCAEACEPVDGMEECGAVCRWCAAACRDLGR